VGPPRRRGRQLTDRSTSVPTPLSNPARSRLIRSLDIWHFEPHRLPEEEILACTIILFEVLYCIEGMEEAVGIPLCECKVTAVDVQG
jgi:hypothetical protein